MQTTTLFQNLVKLYEQVMCLFFSSNLILCPLCVMFERHIPNINKTTVIISNLVFQFALFVGPEIEEEQVSAV